MLKKKPMTDGIRRDPEAQQQEDVWRDMRDGSFRQKPNEHCFGERRLRWPTAADGDGKTEPPTMDEVWPGRRMLWGGDMVVLTGAPPEWYERAEEWEVAVRLGDGYGADTYLWRELTPINPTTRLTVETTDPDEVQRRLGEVGRIVEVDDE